MIVAGIATVAVFRKACRIDCPAIGLNSNLVKLVKSGGKPLLLGACCWVSITAVSLLMQHVMGLW